MKTWIAAIALLSAATSGVAQAEMREPSLNAREYRVEQRIDRAWRAGELTRSEYRRLSAELRDIERNERYFMQDGRLTLRERDVLQARLDTLARAVYREARDDERRSGFYNGNYADRRY
jgi:hypothetical protein